MDSIYLVVVLLLAFSMILIGCIPNSFILKDGLKATKGNTSPKGGFIMSYSHIIFFYLYMIGLWI